MNVAGIIAEYNPFHLGHQYQVQSLRKSTNVDYVIVVMSGNFLQRGTPSLLDKYIRAKMALLQGVDLVLELPTLFSTASAEWFALGGISLLNTTGVVDTVCFGAETDHLEKLSYIANIFCNEPKEYASNLQKYLKQGFSYPLSRAKALGCYEDIINTPNNILAIEYLKALIKTNSSMHPYVIKRIGNGYHDISLKNRFVSATAIRKSLFENSSYSQLESFLPDTTFKLFSQLKSNNYFLSENDFSLLLKYKLISQTSTHLNLYSDSTPALTNRISNHLNNYLNWTQFIGLLKSKDITYTRISRLLTHILLDIKSADFDYYKHTTPLPYLKILGFKKDATPLLNQIKKRGYAPMITKVATSMKNLSDGGKLLIQKDIFASNIYQSVLTEKTRLRHPNEFERKMMVIP